MIDTLTSFRFFAALLVFIAHIAVFTGWGYLERLNLGYSGVGFFYILSGFILTYVYMDKLKKPNLVSIKRFYISRIAKVYPVHLLTFLAAIPLVVAGAATLFAGGHTRLHLLVAAITTLTLTQSWVPDPSVFFSFNGVAWSISVEVFFYLMFPLLVFLVSRYAKVLTVRNMVLGAAFVWVVMMCIYITYQTMDNDWKLYILPLARLPEFITGILLERIFVMTRRHPTVKTLFNARNASKVEVSSIIVLIAAIVVTVTLPLSVTFSLWLVPAWALTVFVFAHQKGKISRILQIKPLVFLGNVSFSFYMTHQLVIRYLDGLPLTRFAIVLLSLVISLVISSIVYVVYEEPARMKVKSVLERKFAYKKRVSPFAWAKMVRKRVRES